MLTYVPSRAFRPLNIINIRVSKLVFCIVIGRISIVMSLLMFSVTFFFYNSDVSLMLCYNTFYFIFFHSEIILQCTHVNNETFLIHHASLIQFSNLHVTIIDTCCLILENFIVIWKQQHNENFE